ncbi:FeoA family protein [Streptococcus ferus]|uniref:Ferrous iron transport protein A n=1 Tax=Streptococcus ferus TaxID=1345 RepID=A0A2X3VE39_9STRE|nr:ferrous iron transport protein A [Streptococcus ferus]SQF39700.1 ferrous iron transport protein A [Streptococcus ferus]
MRLACIEKDKTYEILSLDFPQETGRHLSDLGLQVGQKVRLVSKNKDSAIIMVKSSRLAFDKSILEKIDVGQVEQEEAPLPLSDLQVGQSALIYDIFAPKAIKRRLMDMGITKKTKIYLRKVAPLGDPIEITLRGYELTLRKSEAQLISVLKLEGDSGDN